ncbi:ribosomal protein L18, putative [Plasmodium knowlesi strain H]|uniref:Ribosomal protein L18, putative n=3 Tax=Plasmodium knowlesi TaxID=5850 RepID=A0A5K1TZB4_PLAKH|nr:50S ribosomal protein L18, apicoplast, putative [Plasmodium knowlesi strain H]OTN64572.1 putative Ribosomal protein L18 [Plasmodium knowlesi]CAA9989191.1 50S ribosomal protein L18, apicoplast, putative [Plasmodium knowlesi strain H]SBO27410.1 ribosomal protein L18, putative [Plasmodium knowlesi strain H]SBO27413.1 ribosomal protein L18, putative [Plasmodium knowlesi strain H]VVS78665.1 50S ribosomal protein L18, apicoplast, putative [Plasmodium knowlesi strain H]|eukprot:XP_002261538.1 ribosomal protein L18, putative [Plasmodium knowlesi strain H]
MNAPVLLVPLLLLYLDVLHSFATNRAVFPRNPFSLFSSPNRKKAAPEQAPQGKAKKLKEKKKKKKNIALERLICEHAEKAEKVEKREVSDNPSVDVDKEILEGKRVPRLRIKNTNKHIYATVVDDYRRHILCFSCSRDPNLSGVLGTYRNRTTNRVVNNGKTIKSGWEIGKDIARKALNKGIFKVRFDRGKFKYAGKVEALAEGARAVGLML